MQFVIYRSINKKFSCKNPIHDFFSLPPSPLLFLLNKFLLIKAKLNQVFVLIADYICSGRSNLKEKNHLIKSKMEHLFKTLLQQKREKLYFDVH